MKKALVRTIDRIIVSTLTSEGFRIDLDQDPKLAGTCIEFLDVQEDLYEDCMTGKLPDKDLSRLRDHIKGGNPQMRDLHNNRFRFLKEWIVNQLY